MYKIALDGFHYKVKSKFELINYLILDYDLEEKHIIELEDMTLISETITYLKENLNIKMEVQ